ncbi:MAG: hypothetical protein ACJ786_12365 [Catenulispora sp.]
MDMVISGSVVAPVTGPEAIAPGTPAGDCPAPGWIAPDALMPPAAGGEELPHALAANKVATATAANPAFRD